MFFNPLSLEFRTVEQVKENDREELWAELFYPYRNEDDEDEVQTMCDVVPASVGGTTPRTWHVGMDRGGKAAAVRRAASIRNRR